MVTEAAYATLSDLGGSQDLEVVRPTWALDIRR